MARCNSCNKFVSLNTEEDAEDVEVSIDGAEVSISANIHNDCQECGEVMFTAELSNDGNDEEVESHIAAHERNSTWFGVTNDQGVRTCNFCGVVENGSGAHDKQRHAEKDPNFKEAEFMSTPDTTDFELEAEENGTERIDRFEGKGRGVRHFYGVEVSYKVTCNACPDWAAEGTMSAEIQASGMDEAQ